MRKLIALALGVTFSLVASSQVQPLLPSNLTPLADVGFLTPEPFIYVCAGQSQIMGVDDGGSKTVGANIYMTNDFRAPTAVIPAAFGVAPLNQAFGGGTTTNPALAHNNPCIQAATQIRNSGALAASRPIVIIFNAYGSQSIDDWVDASASNYMWGQFINTAIPLVNTWMTTNGYGTNWVFNLIDWAQGEADNQSTGFTGSISGTNLTISAINTNNPVSSLIGPLQNIYGAGITPGAVSVVSQTSGASGGAGVYVITPSPGTIGSESMAANSLWATKALYGSAFATLVSQWQALPYWSTTETKLITHMLGGGYGSGWSNRNDFLSTLADGNVYPFATAIPTDTSGVNLTGSISGTTLTVTAVQAGIIQPGIMTLYGAGLSGGDAIVSQLTGTTGLAGTYQLASSQSITSQGFSASPGLASSSENGPHFSGASQVIIGSRVFQAWNRARISGKFSGNATGTGTQRVAENVVQMGVTATTTPVNLDSVQPGTLLQLLAGTIQLPDPAVATAPLDVYIVNSLTIQGTGNLSGVNLRIPSVTGFTSALSSVTMSGGRLWKFIPNSGYWYLIPVFPAIGNSRDYSIAGGASPTSCGSQTSDGVIEWISGGTMAVSMGNDGSRCTIVNYGSASTLTSTSIIGLDGVSYTSYPVAANSVVVVEYAFSSASTHAVFVISDSAYSGSTSTKTTPTTGTTDTTPPTGWGNQLRSVTPAGTLASLTEPFPASPKAGQQITYVFTQAITALTFSPTTASFANGSAVTANTKLTFFYDATDAVWQ
jgi:hypothetical protein